MKRMNTMDNIIGEEESRKNPMFYSCFVLGSSDWSNVISDCFDSGMDG